MLNIAEVWENEYMVVTSGGVVNSVITTQYGELLELEKRYEVYPAEHCPLRFRFAYVLQALEPYLFQQQVDITCRPTGNQKVKDATDSFFVLWPESSDDFSMHELTPDGVKEFVLKMGQWLENHPTAKTAFNGLIPHLVGELSELAEKEI